MTEAMSIKKLLLHEAMSMIKFCSCVFRVSLMTVNNKSEKMTESSASVCLLLARALLLITAKLASP